jgi:hypothetical protein
MEDDDAEAEEGEEEGEEEEDEEEDAAPAKGKGKAAAAVSSKKGKGKPKKKQHDSDDEEDDEEEGPARKKARTVSSAESAIRSKHVIFVDNPAAVAQFRPSAYFETTPALARRTFNRLKTSQLEEGNVLMNDVRGQQKQHAAAAAAAAAAEAATPSGKAATSAHKTAAATRAAQASSALLARSDQSLLASYSEMQARLARKRKLDGALDKLQLEKNLASKGRRSKQVTRDERFGDVDDTKTVYKWKLERKK